MYFIEKDDDQFWITSGLGLFRFDVTKKIFTRYQSPYRLKGWNVDSSGMLKKDTGNILWISTGHGLDKLDVTTGMVKNYASRPDDRTSLSNNLVISMYTDHQNRLWVGTDKGLSRLVNPSGIFKQYLAAFAVIHVHQDNAGVIWAATSDGLYRYNPPSDDFTRFTDESGTPASQVIFWLQQDKANNLWLTGNATGIIKLNATRTVVTVYGVNQGVNCFGLTGYICLRNNGHLIVPDTAGYYDIDPEKLSKPQAPDVVISNFLLNNNTVKPSAGGTLQKTLQETTTIKLAHNQNTFSFQFTNVDFSSEPDDARLIYRLENYDLNWRNAGEAREAYYFGLPPGNYIFRVKAISASGGTAEKKKSP